MTWTTGRHQGSSPINKPAVLNSNYFLILFIDVSRQLDLLGLFLSAPSGTKGLRAATPENSVLERFLDFIPGGSCLHLLLICAVPCLFWAANLPSALWVSLSAKESHLQIYNFTAQTYSN